MIITVQQYVIRDAPKTDIRPSSERKKELLKDHLPIEIMLRILSLSSSIVYECW